LADNDKISRKGRPVTLRCCSLPLNLGVDEMPKFDKKSALPLILDCARKYALYLAGRNLLFLYLDTDNSVMPFEVCFEKSNFLHLTGLKVSDDMSPSHFFRKAASARLKETDFNFSDDGTTQLKLEVLPKLMRNNLSANMFGIYGATQPRLFTEKLVGNISAYMGFVLDDRGVYRPNTVLQGDIRDSVQQFKRIIVTYSKLKTTNKYEQIVYYASKNIDWDNIQFPKDYKYLPKPNLRS